LSIIVDSVRDSSHAILLAPTGSPAIAHRGVTRVGEAERR
jgi:hypothetical protein